MSSPEQIEAYLEKTNESIIAFNSMADSTEYLQRLDEAKKLRFDLAKQGSSIVIPLLRATEPIIKQRAGLPRFSITQFNQKAYTTTSKESIQAVLQNTQELIRDIGVEAERPLIISLRDTSLCVRTQAALCLGLKSVRSIASVPHLEKIFFKDDELYIAVKLAAGVSLLVNDDTDQKTWDDVLGVMKAWADKVLPSWEAGGRKQGMNVQDTLAAMVQGMIPDMLAKKYFF